MSTNSNPRSRMDRAWNKTKDRVRSKSRGKGGSPTAGETSNEPSLAVSDLATASTITNFSGNGLSGITAKEARSSTDDSGLAITDMTVSPDYRSSATAIGESTSITATEPGDLTSDTKLIIADITLSPDKRVLGMTAGGNPTTETANLIITAVDEPAIPVIIVSHENSLSAQISGVNPTDPVEPPGPEIIISDENSGEEERSICWKKSLDGLTDKHRQVLGDSGIMDTRLFKIEIEIKTIQRMKARCTEHLTGGKKPIMTRARIHGILKKMEKYVIIGDIAIQQNPDIVALVWAGVRFCLQVALNDMQTFEAVSTALEDVAGVMGSCRIYEKIHWSNEYELQSAEAVVQQVPRLYTVCLRFMAEAIEFFNTKAPKRVVGGITNPFETRFKPLIDDIKSGTEELERRASVAGHELQEKMSQTQKEAFGELNKQLRQVGSGVEGLLAHVGETKRREVLGWLSKVDFTAHHEKAGSVRFDGTGNWLFGKPALASWLEAECSSVMWLYGKAGSGKTVLSSLVIDTLTETYKSAPTIYFYCHYGETERQMTSSIIRTLLKQLSIRLQALDPEMVSTYNNSMPLNIKASEASFANALTRFEKVFVVVDALDECSEEERKTMVMLLTRQLRLTGTQVKIFLTSRPENDLRQLLQHNTNHQIDANDTAKDITPFVYAAVGNLITSKALLGGVVTSTLRRDLVRTISEKADGMFLWAKFQLDHICKQGNESEVRDQLTKLPAGLNQTYDQIWAKFNGELSNATERKWALKTLALVLRAKRPLTQIEMLEATALDPLDTISKPRMASSIDYLIQVCGNFIALDAGTTILRFVHYSVQEYLDSKPEFESSEADMAELCFVALAQTPSSHGGFYRYAQQFWEAHTRYWKEINARRGLVIERFLLHDQCFMDWRMELQGQKGIGFSDTPCQIVSRFNLPVVLKYLLRSPRSHESIPVLWKSLMISVREGYSAIVKICLDAGVDVNHCHLGVCALSVAARNCGGKVVKILLDSGANITQSVWRAAVDGGSEDIMKILVAVWTQRGDDLDQFALKVAVDRHSEKLVKLLLAAGADVNAGSGYVLQCAVSREYRIIVELLLQAGADVNTGSGSVLECAVSEGYRDIVKLLLDAGADVNAGSGSLLQSAVSGRYRDIVELLLQAGVDVNAGSGFVLQCAVSGGYKDIVELLLQAGVDVNAGSGFVLQSAVSGRSRDIVKLLLDAGADVNSRSGSGLPSAVSGGNRDIVELLLDAGADAGSGSLLQSAVSGGYRDIVKLLLDAGADVNAGSVLQCAVNGGYRDIVELLLDAGADVNAGSGSLLQSAVSGGYRDIIELLLQAGADVNAGSGSVLQLAASGGFEYIVELLLDAGANADVRQAGRTTALYAAVCSGSDVIVELLLAAGASVNTEVGNGLSVLQAAVSRGSDTIVRLLIAGGADINSQGGLALLAAVRKGDAKSVELLLSAGFDVETHGESALHIAARIKSKNMLALLLVSAPDTDTRIKLPLYAAAYRRSTRIVEMLLAGGANCDTQAGLAFQFLASDIDKKLVEQLLTDCAIIDPQSPGLCSALTTAARIGDEASVELLLAAGVNVNLVDQWAGSPLELAAKNGHAKVVELMLAAGADVNAGAGSILQSAVIEGFDNVVELLLTAGTDVNFSNPLIGFALQTAAANGFEKIAQLLITAGADVNAQRGDIESPLEAATKNNSESVVELLLAAGAGVDHAQREAAITVAAEKQYGKIERMLRAASAGENSHLTADDSDLTPENSPLTNEDSHLTAHDSHLTANDSNVRNDDSHLTADDSNLRPENSPPRNDNPHLTAHDSDPTAENSPLRNDDSNLTANDSNLTSDNSHPTQEATNRGVKKFAWGHIRSFTFLSLLCITCFLYVFYF